MSGTSRRSAAASKCSAAAWTLLSKLGDTQWRPLLLGLISLALILVLRRAAPVVPAPLVAVLFGILAVYAFSLQHHGFKIVGHIDGGLPSFGFPGVPSGDYLKLAGPAVGIMLVGFAEGLGASKTYAARNGYDIDTNRELAGLGAPNLAAGLSSGMVVNGSLSKTAVNGGAGARTQLSRADRHHPAVPHRAVPGPARGHPRRGGDRRPDRARRLRVSARCNGSHGHPAPAALPSQWLRSPTAAALARPGGSEYPSAGQDSRRRAAEWEGGSLERAVGHQAAVRHGQDLRIPRVLHPAGMRRLGSRRTGGRGRSALTASTSGASSPLNNWETITLAAPRLRLPSSIRRRLNGVACQVPRRPVAGERGSQHRRGEKSGLAEFLSGRSSAVVLNMQTL